ALRVRLERQRAAAAKRAMQEKVESFQIRQLVALDRPVDHAFEMRRDRGQRDELAQHVVPLRPERDQPNVGRIALVARACVRDVEEANLRHRTSTFVRTTDLSTSAGQYATISSTFGRPPANPVTLGGPFNTSGAISRVNRSIAPLSLPRTPNRSCTSGGSCGSPARRPCVADTPTNSVSM